MSRVNRIARALIAVRPFPLTSEMKQIVKDSSDKLYKILRRIEPLPSKLPYQIYAGEISVKGRSIDLRVVVDRQMFQAEIAQARGDFEKDEVEIYLNIGRPYMDYKSISDSYEFWTSFQTRLLHELIHAFDPKFWVKSIRQKFPKSIDPRYGDANAYFSHPLEKSANQGQIYYYFIDAFERGLSLKESIKEFFRENHYSSMYLDFIKGKDPKSYNEYKTRVYKSAVQAYEDVAKERQ